MVDKYERFTLWYLRLNGYLTVPNYILHPLRPGGQRGEVDILGVRFPHSQEEAGDMMDNDNCLVLRDADEIDFIIVEVTRSDCKINDLWEKPDRADQREYILKWLGMLDPKDVSRVAEVLCSEKRYRDDKQSIRLVSLGAKKSKYLSNSVVQLTFDHVYDFINERLSQFNRIKRDVPQWDEFDRKLLSWVSKSKQEFLDWLRASSN